MLNVEDLVSRKQNTQLSETQNRLNLPLGILQFAFGRALDYERGGEGWQTLEICLLESWLWI
jgi:hypothetical protein